MQTETPCRLELVAKAVQERCAKECDTEAKECRDKGYMQKADQAEDCASAIRALTIDELLTP